MRQYDKAALLEEGSRDLRLRLELCEADKKAYYETTQWTLKQNKEEISKLKYNNKDLAEQVGVLKKKYDTNPDKRIDVVSKMEQRILDLQKKHDGIKAQIKAKADRLDTINKHLESSDIIPDESITEEDEKQEMVDLENKLEKVMIKFTECGTMRKIYEQILRALNRERTQFDQQLSAFERTLKMKRQDVHELEQMSKDAMNARDNAKAELSKFEGRIIEERKHREKDIARLKEIIRNRRSSDEKQDKKSTDDTNGTGESNQDKVDGRAKQEMLAKMDGVLRIIKDSTGISRLSDLMNKMNELQQTNQNLNSLKVQYEQKLSTLREQKSINANVEVVQRPSTGSNVNNKQQLLNKEKAELVEIKANADKLSDIMTKARLGVYQLYDKLEAVQTPSDANKKSERIKVDESTIQQALQVCQEKLNSLVLNIAQKEETEISLPTHAIAKAILPTHNVRVGLQQQSSYSDSEESENDNEVLDREALKKYTAQMLNARFNSKANAKKKKSIKDGNSSD